MKNAAPRPGHGTACRGFAYADHTEYFATAASSQDQPEAGAARGDGAVHDLDRFGQDGAAEVENFEPMRGRRHREHVGAGLGEQMARHRNRGGFGLCRDAHPSGDAADLHQIRHDEVAGAGGDGFGKAARKPPVLAGLNRDRRLAAHRRKPLKILLRHRLLDPVQVVGRKPRDAADGLGGIERLVEVDHQRDVGPDQLAHALHHALVIGGVAVAALDLDAAKALVQRALQVLLVGDGIDHAVTVIGPHRPRRAAQQLGQWLTRRLSQRIVERHVEAGHRHARPGPASRAAGIWHPSPPSGRTARSALPVRSRPISSIRCTSGFSVSLGVGENVGAPGNALIGRDIDQHQRRRLDDAEGVLHRPRDRRDDGPGLDAADGWRGRAHAGSLLDTVPSHEPRRGPVGRHRLRSASGRHIRRQTRCAGSARPRSPAYRARTASSRRRAGRAAGNDGRADGRRSGSRRGWSAPAPRCGRAWRGRPVRWPRRSWRASPSRSAARPASDRSAVRS